MRAEGSLDEVEGAREVVTAALREDAGAREWMGVRAEGGGRLGGGKRVGGRALNGRRGGRSLSLGSLWGYVQQIGVRRSLLRVIVVVAVGRAAGGTTSQCNSGGRDSTRKELERAKDDAGTPGSIVHPSSSSTDSRRSRRVLYAIV